MSFRISSYSKNPSDENVADSLSFHWNHSESFHSKLSYLDDIKTVTRINRSIKQAPYLLDFMNALALQMVMYLSRAIASMWKVEIVQRMQRMR